MVLRHHINRFFAASPAENEGFVWTKIRIGTIRVYEGAARVSSYLSRWGLLRRICTDVIERL
jgi:predicted transcriptional regulator